jgi:Flp pilus assembly protein CpaB
MLMLLAAAGAGLLAVAVVGGYSSSVAESYGELRPVVVVTRSLLPGKPISPQVAAGSFEVREIPARFVPAAALADPGQAVGLVPVGPLPAGSYLTGPGLEPPVSEKPKRPSPGRGRHAVELSVAGAGALSGSGRVDVLVTTDDDRGGGETLVAARRVPLISIGRSGQSETGPGLTEVTLGLTRQQAVRLVDAQTFARRITVLPPVGS